MRDLILGKLKARADRIIATPLSELLSLRVTSNLFILQSLFKDLGAAHAELGDARYLEFGLEAARYLYRGGWEQCGLIEEIHHAFVLNGLGDFFWRNEAHIPAADAQAIRELAGRVGAALMLDGSKQEWGRNIPMRNAWNHTVIAYSGIGVAGFLAAQHPEAESWRRVGLERLQLFFRDGVTPAGMTREGISYCGFVFRNVSVLMHAARATGQWDYTLRRDNPYLDRLEKVPLWYAAELFPSGRYLQNWNDAYWNPLPAMVGFLSVFRDLAPAAVAYVWNRLVGPDGNGSFGACLVDSSISETVRFPPDLSLASTFSPPSHFYCEDHGYFAGTAGASGREAKLSFGAGPYIGAIHDQADNNSFTLFLDGLPVIIDGGAVNEPQEGTASSSFGHAAIVIDGKGQLPSGRGHGCSGVITHVHAEHDHIVVAGDAREAYGESEYNPVRKALRQCVLALGKQPYLVVFDDICKDAKEHSYESLFHTPRLADVRIDVASGTVRGSLEFDNRAASLVMRVVSPALDDILRVPFVARGQPPFDEHDLWSFKLRAKAARVTTLIYLEQPGDVAPTCELVNQRDRLELAVRYGASGFTDTFVSSPHAASEPFFSRAASMLEPATNPAEPAAVRRPLLNASRPMTSNKIVRKVRKLVRNPEQFLSDSPVAALQRLGAILKGDTHNSASRRARSSLAPPYSFSRPASNGQGSSSAPRQRALDRNNPTENSRLGEQADDLKKLAGFAAALATTDYPTADESVVMGQSTYRVIGLEFLRYFMMWGDLTPEDDVLDVGCGGGRMAAAIGYYLASTSSYVGFDVDKASIEWCRDNISVRWPNFRFDHFDIANSSYNPKGALTGQNFHFPYPDASFSFVIATSVFTHQMRQEVKHYLSEVFRTLRPGGRLFSTAFLMTPAAELSARKTPRAVKFDYEVGENPVHVLERPLAAVAQRESAFLEDVNEVGLVMDRVAYGWWSGLPTSNSKQDIIVLRKP